MRHAKDSSPVLVAELPLKGDELSDADAVTAERLLDESKKWDMPKCQHCKHFMWKSIAQKKWVCPNGCPE